MSQSLRGSMSSWVVGQGVALFRSFAFILFLGFLFEVRLSFSTSKTQKQNCLNAVRRKRATTEPTTTTTKAVCPRGEKKRQQCLFVVVFFWVGGQ